MDALVLVVLSIGAMPCCVWAGYALARHRFGIQVHVHAYGLWEDCRVRDGKYRQGVWVEELIAGQMRDCLGCGERQVRTVTTQEAV